MRAWWCAKAFGGGGAGKLPADGGVMLVCRLESWVNGEPTLIMPGELTEMLAGDMATVCRELMAVGPTGPATELGPTEPGGMEPAAAATAAADPGGTPAPMGTGIGVPSGSNCSLKPWNWL